MNVRCIFPIISFLLSLVPALAQERELQGMVTDPDGPVPLANVYLRDLDRGTATDVDGRFLLEGLPDGSYTLVVSAVGYRTHRQSVRVGPGSSLLEISLQPRAEQLNETVVTGTLKAVRRFESPVPVEVYSPAFIRRNPTANVFEALQTVNGVRPQINCNVCNTGDIHINGLEGPYTLVLIDGMPIVSGLGTVYGLSGIPNALIEQIEIVKGPASSLYGSEAVGGLINIITKNALTAPEFFADGFATGWGEYNLDAGGTLRLGENTRVLTGVNYFNYDLPVDNNGDNFTDVTLQDRISVFQKWNFTRASSREFSLAGRFFYEDRWGGEMQWTPEFRGTDSIYGESIYTRRWELLGRYQLPLPEKLLLSVSYNDHRQDSWYGDLPYLADQRIGFGQLSWDKTAGNHDLLVGAALRYNYYDDNTPATGSPEGNDPDRVWIPSLFAQDEYRFSGKHTLLAGLRYDQDPRHGSIWTPRGAVKLQLGEHELLRLNFGTGFRVVNLFTEDHAALTGARDVVIAEDLLPEQSWNLNLNYLRKFYTPEGHFFSVDASAFYTDFSNQILPDYDSDPNRIFYRNLDGRSVSRGFSANLDAAFANGLRIAAGTTLQDVRVDAEGANSRPVLTERYSATWSVSFPIRPLQLTADYTGNLYGPMRLPLAGDLDPRPEYSPAWSIQNIQFTFKGLEHIEIYAGVKNLLNWTPNRGTPFLIARSGDPFDKQVQYDASGDPVPSPGNPYGLTFDPAYVYGPNQGIRGFAGLRYQL